MPKPETDTHRILIPERQQTVYDSGKKPGEFRGLLWGMRGRVLENRRDQFLFFGVKTGMDCVVKILFATHVIMHRRNIQFRHRRDLTRCHAVKTVSREKSGSGTDNPFTTRTYRCRIFRS